MSRVPAPFTETLLDPEGSAITVALASGSALPNETGSMTESLRNSAEWPVLGGAR